MRKLKENDRYNACMCCLDTFTFFLYPVAFVPMAKKGESQTTLTLAKEVIRQAPQSSAANKVKEDLPAGRGDLKCAQASFEKAVKQPEVSPCKRAEEIIDPQANSAAKKRMDRLIGELIARYNSRNYNTFAQTEEDWPSRPILPTLTDVQGKSGLSGRDGLGMVLASRLGSRRASQ